MKKLHLSEASIVAIVVAVIGLVGTLGTALITSNSNKPSPTETATPTTVQTQTTAPTTLAATTTPVPSATATLAPSSTLTDTPTLLPSSTATTAPTITPTLISTTLPTSIPSIAPTDVPTTAVVAGSYPCDAHLSGVSSGRRVPVYLDHDTESPQQNTYLYEGDAVKVNGGGRYNGTMFYNITNPADNKNGWVTADKIQLSAGCPAGQ